MVTTNLEAQLLRLAQFSLAVPIATLQQPAVNVKTVIMPLMELAQAVRSDVILVPPRQLALRAQLAFRCSTTYAIAHVLRDILLL